MSSIYEIGWELADGWIKFERAGDDVQITVLGRLPNGSCYKAVITGSIDRVPCRLLGKTIVFNDITGCALQGGAPEARPLHEEGRLRAVTWGGIGEGIHVGWERTDGVIMAINFAGTPNTAWRQDFRRLRLLENGHV